MRLLAPLLLALALSLCAGDAVVAFPLEWRPSRSAAEDHPAEHRRLAAQSGSTAFLADGVVGGNTAQLGYFYVTLEVGSPPQRQTVIFDTGSHVTAFPCSTCKSNCGQHMDQPFDIAKSSTAAPLKCGTPGCTCKSKACVYSVRYTEGSSISGTYYTDTVWVEPTPPKGVPVLSLTDSASRYGTKFQFGCHQKETKLFRTQKADGIFGAGNTANNLVHFLKKDGKVDKSVFSICLAKEGGVYTLGGVDERMLKAPLTWASMGGGKHYTIQVKDLQLDGKSVGIAAGTLNKGYGGFMLDTGTTYSYLNSAVLAKLKSAFDAYCKKAGASNCKGSLKKQRNEHHCYALASEADLDSFPGLTVPLKDGGQIDIGARQYMTRVGNNYCVGFYSNGGGGNLLGGNVMRDHVYEFDLEAKKVGIAPADCDPADLGVACVLGEWGEWSACSSDSSGGTQTRTRTVERDPAHGGAACAPLADTRACPARALSVPSPFFVSSPSSARLGLAAVAAVVVAGVVVRKRRQGGAARAAAPAPAPDSPL